MERGALKKKERKKERKRSLVCYSPRGRKKLDTTKQPNNNYDYTVYKNKLKMDQRPKCRTGNHKTLRRKHRQNTLTQKYFLGCFLMQKKQKKNKQMRSN